MRLNRKWKATTLLLGATAVAAQGQGLLNMGSDDDFYSGLPFTTSVGVEFLALLYSILAQKRLKVTI